MTPTTYQTPEIRDSNDNIIKQGSFGKNTALANSTNDGWIDYVANDLEFLYGLAKDEVVPVSELPSAGDTNKTYLLTTTGVCYRWSGTEWVAVSSSEAVSRADSAAYLAEQWATKTSGTVDGTEYSAKYYAEQAQDTADDLSESLEQIATNTANIEENAENIATNTGNIAQNTTDIDIAEKRIGNIEKLLQGNLYDYQTDSTSAYTKTVPQGAMPYASLEQIGGKTLVWNQLNDNSGATGNAGGIDFTNNGDGSWTINGTATSSTTKIFGYNDFVNGHKYYIKGCPAGGSASTYSFGVAGGKEDIGSGGMLTATATGHYNLRFNFASGTTFNNVKVYPQLTDLTLCYGAGNEPTSVAEFTSQFPANYYAYTQGQLLSAGVTSVVSKGKNLLNTQRTVEVSLGYSTASTKRNLAENQVWKGISYSGLTYNIQIDSYSVGNGTITYNSKTNGWGIAFPIKVKPSTKYTFHCIKGNTSGMFFLQYDADGYLTSNTYNNYTYDSITLTTTASTVWLMVGFAAYNATINTDITVTDIMVEESATASTYTPYQEHTYPIPAEIQALEGYGWSAGSVYNYIDYEAKKFVKNVVSVTYNGTEDWEKQTDINNPYYYLKVGNNGDVVDHKVVCDSFETVTIAGTNTNVGIDVINSSGYNAARILIRRADMSGSKDDFKTWLASNNITVNYALSTPQETDISAYLTDDNLIEVESGGTLTFPNSNGTDYQIPVPSAETYMVDLQASL